MSLNPDNLLESLGRHVHLGHATRDACFLRQVALAVSAPGAPLPQAADLAGSGWPDLLSLYRFAANEAMALPALRLARARTVLDPLPLGADLLVIHDLTQLDYSRHNSKRDRRPIGDHGGMGYEYASCLAVDPHTATVLGVLHDTVINAHGPDDRDAMDYDYQPLFADFSPEDKKRLAENHCHQMAVHVRGLAPLLAPYRPVDVADREFDDLFVLHSATEGRRSFVIRCKANRNVQVRCHPWLPAEALTPKQAGHPCPPGWICAHLAPLVQAVPLARYKTLPLDKDGRVAHTAPAAARMAHLSIGACRVRLYRPAKRNQRYFRLPEPIELNLVVIRETAPPAGVVPLLWVLFTNLPVDTPEQLAWVGHLYELRWATEPFYRLLKSGYRVEREKLDSADKIARTLVVLTTAAMAVLHLKADLGLPVEGHLGDEDYRRIKEAVREPNNPHIPLPLRLFALVVRYGGWIGRRSDRIGPTILMRGLLQVLAILDAFARCGPLLEEAQQHSDIIRRMFCV